MTSRNLRTSLFPVLLALFMLALPAYSSTIDTFTTSTSWADALSSFQTLNFAGLAPTNGYTMYPGGATVNGVQFLGMNASSVGFLDTTNAGWYNFGPGDAAFIFTNRPNDTAPVPYITITLPTPVTAVGFNLISYSPTALPYSITIGGTQYTVPTASTPTPVFWGITSDTPFSTVDVSLLNTTYNAGTYALLNNFSFGTATQLNEGDVPESSTCLLFGAGLTGLGFLRRRHKAGTPK